MNEMNNSYIFKLSKVGERLWGYELGRQVRGDIEALLENVPVGKALIIQLEDVEVMDFSFSNEVFGKLYSTVASVYPGRALVLANPSEYVKINLDAALKPLGHFALLVTEQSGWELIGKFSQTDQETLKVLSRLRRAKAPEVAEELDIKLTTCNQRLRKLVESGVILRSKVPASTGGEQYLYSWPL